MAEKAFALRQKFKRDSQDNLPVDATPDIPSDIEQVTASQLPDPTGYQILIALPEPDEMTGGGIIKSKATMNTEEVSSVVGFVVKMGPDCYADKQRFPNGPYCEVGDFIIMRAYSGTRLKIHSKEYRLLNDDSIQAVVENPTGIIKC